MGPLTTSGTTLVAKWCPKTVFPRYLGSRNFDIGNTSIGFQLYISQSCESTTIIMTLLLILQKRMMKKKLNEI